MTLVPIGKQFVNVNVDGVTLVDNDESFDDPTYNLNTGYETEILVNQTSEGMFTSEGSFSYNIDISTSASAYQPNASDVRNDQYLSDGARNTIFYGPVDECVVDISVSINKFYDDNLDDLRIYYDSDTKTIDTSISKNDGTYTIDDNPTSSINFFVENTNATERITYNSDFNIQYDAPITNKDYSVNFVDQNPL